MIGTIMHGIIGFLRIIKENNDEFATKNENYIEFDTEKLRNFDKYYFKFFFNKYNVAQSVIDRTQNQFEYIENNIEKILENKEEEKERKEKIKINKKRIKDIIKKQLDKIKKIDEQIYSNIKEAYEQIEKEETIEGIKKIKNTLLENIQNEKINKKLTLNLFKSILSNTYYGQPSFLNVVKTALTYEQQQDLMYKDYVSNIVETGFLHDILKEQYNIEEIKEYIENAIKNGRITKEMEKIYSKIEKEETIEDIKKYIKEKVIKRCSMCENEYGMTTNYSEGNFVPLAISSDNARNFSWKQNVKFPICDICKLILFCIPAGTTNISKIIKENGEYKEKRLLNFINYDTNVDMLLKTNNNFYNNSKFENKTENPYAQLILDIIKQDQKISEWQLQNIFVVEFEAEYGSFSRIEYFNIRRYVARFFKSYVKNTLSKINNYRYKLQIIDYILKSKDIKYIINEILRDELSKETHNGYNSRLAAKTRLILKLLKKEEIRVEEIEKNEKKLDYFYNLGIEAHEGLKRNKEKNKLKEENKEDNRLNGYEYKILNCIKSRNINEFVHIFIKIHIVIGKDVPKIFLETMKDTGLDFESIGYSFLSGLISNRYEKKPELEQTSTVED